MHLLWVSFGIVVLIFGWCIQGSANSFLVCVGTKGTGFCHVIYCLACEMHSKVTNHEGISGGYIVQLVSRVSLPVWSHSSLLCSCLLVSIHVFSIDILGSLVRLLRVGASQAVHELWVCCGAGDKGMLKGILGVVQRYCSLGAEGVLGLLYCHIQYWVAWGVIVVVLLFCCPGDL